MSHLINAILQFDWPLRVFGTSPRIWTCDTRPLLLAWAGWGPGTKLRLSSPLKKKKKRHLEARTMCSIFICTAQSDHHSPTPETVFFLHVYIPNKHIYTNNFSFINKDNSIQQVNHNYTTSFCWHSWQTNLQPFLSPEQERLVITLLAVSFPDLMTLHA